MKNLILWLILLPAICSAQKTIDNIKGFGVVQFNTPIERIENKKFIAEIGENIHYRCTEEGYSFLGHGDPTLTFTYNTIKNKITSVAVIFGDTDILKLKDIANSNIFNMSIDIVAKLEKVYGKYRENSDIENTYKLLEFIWEGREKRMAVSLAVIPDEHINIREKIRGTTLTVEIFDNK